MALVFAVDDARTDDVRALLETHLGFAHEVTPPGHVHALDSKNLVDPAVTLFTVREDGVLLGVGALRRLDASHVELKSMHVGAAARRRGIGRAMLDHLLAVAADRGYQRASLETGTMDAFSPALRLYEQAGFVPCEPFGEYTANPHSICMTMSI
jgi:putative acetyltransferase